MRIVPCTRRGALAGSTAPAPARRVLLSMLCALLLPACALLAPHFQKPDLSVVGIEMLGGNLFQQNLRITLKIHNPNARPLPIDSLTADLRVGGEPIASGATNRAFVVPANGDTEFDLMVTANLASGVVKLAQLMNDRSAPIDYELTGVVHLDVPLFRSLPFDQRGSFSIGNSSG